MAPSPADQRALRQFAADSSAGCLRPLEAYLPPASDPCYLATLEELVRLEQAQAFARDPRSAALVERYVERFPALDDPAIGLRLVRHEFLLRCQYAAAPEVSEYRARFPRWIATGEELLADEPAWQTVSSSPAANKPNDAVIATQTIDSPAPADLRNLAPQGETLSQRYTLTRLHAEGGLGRVWLAHDASLKRDVALKELRPQQAGRSDACRRFLQEAQVTGQLEHPNIVPVYELGERPGGTQPFYTMRFIRGRTLRSEVAAYHQQRRAGHDDPLVQRRLLQAFVSICQAIAFAHSRGVIHRDLKPENIILGSFGEVLVLDWGLAKLRGQSETIAAVEVSAGERSDATSAGQVLGTPAYMAPEQAAGQIADIDERTDVYGLGAILFEILVGRPPHEGRDTADVLARIIRGPTPRVRQLDPRLPKVTDAVCARAMALRREDRYAEVAQLTADVERYLADEPVSVYTEPWYAQTARWLRRHRTFASMAAAMLVMATTISSVAFVLVRDQKEIAVAALERETHERRRAESELVLAQNAVDQIMGRVSNERLAPLPRNEPIRREMLAVALKFCQGLMVQNPRDPGVRWRTGRAHRQVGGIFQILGRFAEAEEQYAQSIKLLAGLVAEDSRSDDYQRDLAAAFVDHGSLLDREGRPKLAEEAYRQARAMCDTLVEQHPDDADFLVQRAVTDNNLGLLLLATGRPKDAADAHHRALQTYESLAKKWPDALDYQQSVATSYNNLGAVLRTVGAFAPAEKALGHALEIFERLHQKVPDKIDYRLAMAMAAANRAVVLSSLERRDDAEKSYQAATGEFEKLMAEYPTVDDFRYKLAATLSNHVPSLVLAGRPQDALATCQRALDLYDQKAVGEDHVPPPADERAATLYRLGLLRMDAEQLDRAEPALRQSVEAWRKVIQEQPDQPGLQDQFASAAQALAQVVIQRADFVAARPLVEQALAAEQKAISLIAQPHYQRRERDLYVLLGQTLMALREFTGSAEAIDASSRIVPDDGAGERRAAELLAQCVGFAQARKAQDFDAEKWAARAMALLRAARQHGALDRAALEAKVFDPLRKRVEFEELTR